MQRPKLPVVKILRAAFAGTFTNLKGLALPALGALSASLSVQVAREALFRPNELLSWPAQVFSLIGAVPFALFAFVCHRVCLRELGIASMNPSRPGLLAAFVSWSLVGTGLFLLVEVVAPSLTLDHSGEIVRTDDTTALLNSILFFIATFVVVRSSPVLPATAAGCSGGLRSAWELSRGNAWRLFWATLAPFLLLVPVFIFLQSQGLLQTPLAPELPPLTASRFAVNGAVQAAACLATAVGAFVLCGAYAALRQESPAVATGPAA